MYDVGCAIVSNTPVPLNINVLMLVMCSRVMPLFLTSLILPSGGVGNMLAWHAISPGSILGRGIHSDSGNHYNGSWQLDPQWHV